MTIAEQYKSVAASVNAAARAAGRDSSAVTLVGVSKTVAIADIAQAVIAGATDLAENRPERIMEAYAAYPQVRWHFIGNLQGRRIRDVVPVSALIHSVWQEHHLPRIDEAARQTGKVQDILLEVNVSGEESKGGAAPEDVRGLLAAASVLENVRVRGLMTMAPIGSDEQARSTFRGLRELRDELEGEGWELPELSMGMTDDWPIAVEEGATIVRVGRAIFSENFA